MERHRETEAASASKETVLGGTGRWKTASKAGGAAAVDGGIIDEPGREDNRGSDKICVEL